jgi:MFS family permease
MMVGFVILGFNFAQSSGTIASLFDRRNRYTASAVVSALSWMFGAGFAPLAALLLSTWFGLFAAGLYLLSGAVCTLISLALARQISLQPKGHD